MNDRIRKLRSESLSAVPYLTDERARIVTETYNKYSGKVSVPVLRALVFRNIMENKAIDIQDGELIVGERGPKPHAVPTYPELCCHTDEDLRIINDREKISFKVSSKMKEYYAREIRPYWEGRSMRDLIFSNMTEEWKNAYEAGIFTEFMEQRAGAHSG